jgi:hypothetical protein
MSGNGWRVCWIEAAFGTSLDRCVRLRDAIKGFCADQEFRVKKFLLWIDKVPSKRRPNLV